MRVLLATDGSDHAAMAHDLVNAIDWPEGSTVRIVTVAQPLDVVFGAPWAARLAEEMDALTAELGQRAESIVDEAARGLTRAPLTIERVVLHGRPGSCIVDEAGDFGADLIVLGSRGHGPILSMLLGSVAREVTDHAPCPVLVARRPILTRVVLAHDGSPHAMAAEGLLTRWPIFGNTAIEVASVAQQTGPWHLPPSATLYTPSVPDYFETYREILREHTQVAEDAADRLRRAGLRASAVVAEGDPAQTIMHVADEHQADLILLGTHGRTGLERLLLGSVARNVMVHAPISVLVVRPAAEAAA
jgi:nucleotide-binding universal stress UspA family protein